MAIPMRPMGSQGLKVSMQGYGCMGLTAFYGKPLSEEAGLAVLTKAFELGVTHFDTAEVYQGKDGDTTLYNEELVGKFVAKVGRDKVTFATKYFPAGPKEECTPEQVRESFAASLKRLGTDSVDLYYLHRIPFKEGAMESWMKTAKELVAEGKIKYLGVSEATAAQIRTAHAIHPLTAVQQEWSLLIRNLEADVVPTCRELGIGVVAYSPLCRGFTSATVKTAEDWSKIGNEGGAATGFQSTCPHLSGDNLATNAALLAPLEVAAEKAGCTAAQLSLAWVQAQGEDVFPIPGTTKVANLEANVKAAELAISLDKSIFDGLSSDIDTTKVAGERYPPGINEMCFDKKK